MFDIMNDHIGKHISERLNELGMSKSEFARRINRARQNVNDILERKSIDSELLLSICKALRYDFFQYYVKELAKEPEIISPNGEWIEMSRRLLELEAKVIQLEGDLKIAQTEAELLREITDLLRKQTGES